MGIYITGDMHGRYGDDRLFGEQLMSLNEDDYVIVAGDFGYVFYNNDQEKQHLNLIANTIPYNLLFIDGNHENFDVLDSLEQEEWNGGMVSFLKPNIIHLKRGQIFNIEGKTLFTFGGGVSIDKFRRIEGSSWWRRENPSTKEFDEGIDNLSRNENKVNYIITHEASQKYMQHLYRGKIISFLTPDDTINRYFDEIDAIVQYDHWYCGHMHLDKDIDNFSFMYNDIKQIN